MNQAFVEWLVFASLAITVLIPAAWLLSLLLHRLAGPLARYAAWLLVLASLIPASLSLQLPPVVAGATLQSGMVIWGPALEAVQPFPTFLWWLAGAVTACAWFALAHARLWKQVRQHGRKPRPETLRRIHDTGFPRGVPVTVTHGRLPPALFGCLPPRLLVPQALIETGSPDLDLVVGHEAQHLRHLDPWWNALGLGLRCLFWFHPLVHLAWFRFRRDQELAADDAVLRRADMPTRRHYARLLCAPFDIALPGSATPWYSPPLLKERIMQITRPGTSPGRRIAGLVGALALTLCAGALVAGDRAYEDFTEKLEATHRALPVYPRDAAEKGIEGRVRMLASIDLEGAVTVERVTLSEPEGVFDAAAVDAMEQWRFRWIDPDSARPLRVEQVIEFRLTGQGSIEMTTID